MPPTNDKDSDSMDDNGKIIYQVTAEDLEELARRIARKVLAEQRKEQEAEPDPEQPPRFYTRQQCADMLKCSLPTIHKLANEGEIKVTKLGRATRIFADDFDERFKSGRLKKYARR